MPRPISIVTHANLNFMLETQASFYQLQQISIKQLPQFGSLMSQEPSVLQVIVLLPCIEEPLVHSNKAVVVFPSDSNVTEPFPGVDSVLHGSI